MKPTPKKQNGFTLIEIVIVLAIAALIMVIVFLAVQGAQRSRRDTQRKDALNRISAALESAASTSSGNYPGAGAARPGALVWNASTGATPTGTPPVSNYAGTFGAQFLNSDNTLTDPSTGTTFTVVNGAPPTPCQNPAVGAGNPAIIYYQSGTTRTYTATICLEQGSYARTQ